MASINTKCRHCGEPLSGSYTGPCPKCGKEGKAISVSITQSIAVSESIGWQTTKEFYEKNHKALAIVIIITVFSPFIGLFIVGVPGVVLGFLFGVVAYFLGPKAVIKVREIRSG
jgi:uncharacterized membrane protein YvbJ